MRFLTIEPAKRLAQYIDAEDIWQAMETVGLMRNRVDFGNLTRGIQIVVYEFGLFEPDKHHHFAIGANMFAGNAVISSYNEMGDTTDIDQRMKIEDHVTYLGNREETERSIQMRVIPRREIRANGKRVWEWGQPPPFELRKD